MKPAQSQSMKSVCSGKSMKSLADLVVDKIFDLDELVTTACEKFKVSSPVLVRKDFQIDEYYRSMKQAEGPVKYKAISFTPPHAINAGLLPRDICRDSKTEETASKTSTSSIDDRTLVVTGLYDNMNHLTEILLQKYTSLPRVVMQILGLIAPYFRSLTKMTIKRCWIDAYTIYELSKFLPSTTITEICLDGSPLPEANYAILLGKTSCLTSLSLSRCMINDEVCKQISLKLHFKQRAELTLSTLNLSSNHITDVGAKYIGEALRTNRHLRYLNLADNRIDDEGADRIFHALTDFALTHDEIVDNRRRYSNYLRTRQVVYLKYFSECDTVSTDNVSVLSKKSYCKKSKTCKKDKLKFNSNEDIRRITAEFMADELVGTFVDPFTKLTTKLVDGYTHCKGNMYLCYLNLSYNRLSYLSVKKLYSVLLYQSTNKINQTGLLKVIIDGNLIPVTCVELDRIGGLLQKNVISYCGKFAEKRKSVTRGRLSLASEKR